MEEYIYLALESPTFIENKQCIAFSSANIGQYQIVILIHSLNLVISILVFLN